MMVLAELVHRDDACCQLTWCTEMMVLADLVHNDDDASLSGASRS